LSSGSNPFFRLRENLGTVVISTDQLALVPRWTMKDQFERHYDEIRALVNASSLTGYAVIAVYADGVVSAAQLATHLPGEPGGVLVVGRHSEAAMRLAADPTVALRHLAIRVLEDEQGEPEARIIDLNTGQGFHIEGAGRFAGARIAGPAFLRVGSYALRLFPRGAVPRIWPASPEGVFESLVEARVVEDDEGDTNEVVGFVRGGMDWGERGTRITKIGAPVAPRRLVRGAGPLPDETFAVLTVEQAGGETIYPLTAENLERGVLLGRYGRCEVELHRMWVNESSSRVHLLLLKEEDSVLAIDTASSNGTYVDGQRITVVEVPDDAQIELAEGNRVRWHRILKPEEVC
jgi:hypothetical protein